MAQFHHNSRTSAKRTRAIRLRLEQLEQRAVPATLTVTNLNDAGVGSLRAAITTANVDTVKDEIVFDNSLFGGMITLASNLPAISTNMSIRGPGNLSNSIIINANGIARAFNIGGLASFELSNVTLTNGVATDGAAILNNGTAHLTNVVISNSRAVGLPGFQHTGGAIVNFGSSFLELDHCVLTGNFAVNSGGAIANDGNLLINDSRLEENSVSTGNANSSGNGGAIINTGILNLNRTMIAGNRADQGGGIFFGGTLQFDKRIDTCTIADNFAAFEGGGLEIQLPSDSTLGIIITNTTIANNRAGSSDHFVILGGGGIVQHGGAVTLINVTIARNSSISNVANGAGGPGGIVKTSGRLTVRNTIISENVAFLNNAGDDIGSTSIDSGDHNFIGGIAGLGTLRSNGGPVPTMMPASNSPVIDAGSSSADISFGLTRDARGFPRFVDGNLDGSPIVDIGACEFNPGIEQPIAAGTDAGPVARVRVFDYTGALRMDFLPYGSFAGGVRVATGDMNGDGIEDIITAAGPGGGPHVRVFSGLNGTSLASFFAYSTGFTGGVYVAATDVNGDGKADIITGAGAGGGPHVQVFSGANTNIVLRSFLAYGATFAGGVRVAGGDVNHDGDADIITGAGPGGAPHVRVFSGANTSVELASFFAYSTSFTGGVFVASGDVNGDSFDDIITGAGSLGGPNVRVFSGPAPATILQDFFAYATNFTGGVTVAAVDRDGDGRADIITGAGPNGGPHVRGFSGRDLAPVDNFFAFDPSVLSGVFVG